MTRHTHLRAPERHGTTHPDDLDLAPPERWVLEQVRRRGVVGLVLQLSLVAVLSSAVLVTVVTVAIWGVDNSYLVPSVVMATIVPAVVAPPVLLFTVRLAARLDRATQMLWDAAHVDALTGVPNRRAFFDALGQLGHDTGRSVDIGILDIDAFKAINDRHGHRTGDRALGRVAGWLGEQLGPDAVVARIGGDEFAVIAPATGADRPTRAELSVDGLTFTVTIGWARCAAGGDAEAALHEADRRLYAGKPRG